jgi:hypothetical protein
MARFHEDIKVLGGTNYQNKLVMKANAGLDGMILDLDGDSTGSISILPDSANVNFIHTTGNIVIGVTNPSNKLEVSGTVSATNLEISDNFNIDGYTKLGSDAPAIKTKLIEVTTPASVLSAQNTPHNITGTTISCEIICEAVDNKYIKPFDVTTLVSNYTAYVTTTQCSRTSDYTTNTNISNSPLRFYITYIQ